MKKLLVLAVVLAGLTFVNNAQAGYGYFNSLDNFYRPTTSHNYYRQPAYRYVNPTGCCGPNCQARPVYRPQPVYRDRPAPYQYQYNNLGGYLYNPTKRIIIQPSES